MKTDVARIKTSHLAILQLSWLMTLKSFAFRYKPLNPVLEVNVIFNPIVRMKGVGHRVHPEIYSYTVGN